MSDRSYTRSELRALVAERLLDSVPALGGRVHPSRTHPLQASQGEFPAALVYADSLRMTDAGSTVGAPEFQAVVTITVVLRAQARTEQDVDEQLDALSEQAMAGFLEDADFMAIAEGISEMSCLRERRGDSDNVLGQDLLSFDMRFTDRREPRDLARLREVRMVIDAIDPFDKRGNYPGFPEFDPPEAPPRQSGPDGRAEGEVRIIFPKP